MAGRNSKPKKNGPASSPSRLDQFGEKLAEDTEAQKVDRDNNGNKSC